MLVPLSSLLPGDVFLHGGKQYRYDSLTGAGPNSWVFAVDENGVRDTIPLQISVIKQGNNLSPSLSPENLQAAYQQALREPSPVRLKPLKPLEMLVALQRKWAQVYETEPPDDTKALEKVVPSGLSKTERQQFLRGALENGKATWLRLLNTHWTKRELEERCRKEGVTRVLEVFDPKTRRELERAVRFLTDR